MSAVPRPSTPEDATRSAPEPPRFAAGFHATPQRLHWDPVRFRANTVEHGRAFELEHRTEPDLPDASAWATTIARASLECLVGARPLHQLTRWLAPAVFEALSHRVNHAARLRRLPASFNIRARKAHVFHVDDRTCEATCTLFDGARFRACALRLKEHHGRWLVVALEMG